MKNAWPNMLGDNFEFWKSQWNTHGRCTYEFMNQSQYFDTAIRIHKDNNLLNMFTKSSFKPNPYRTYLLSDIRSFLQGVLDNIVPQFRCIGGGNSGVPLQIHEIRLCYDVTGTNRVNCTDRDVSCGTRVAFY